MNGLKYLVSCGHFEMNPRDVAAWLHEARDELDKTLVGEMLGKEKEYKVLIR